MIVVFSHIFLVLVWCSICMITETSTALVVDFVFGALSTVVCCQVITFITFCFVIERVL